MQRALIADDDPDVRMLLRSFLEINGWEVAEAADGDEALRRGGDGHDLVILDQRMPGVAGEEVARRLRAAGYGGPIVMFSAYLTPALEGLLAEQVDADLHFVAKTEFSRLRELVRAYTRA